MGLKLLVLISVFASAIATLNPNVTTDVTQKAPLRQSAENEEYDLEDFNSKESSNIQRNGGLPEDGQPSLSQPQLLANVASNQMSQPSHEYPENLNNLRLPNQQNRYEQLVYPEQSDIESQKPSNQNLNADQGGCSHNKSPPSNVPVDLLSILLEFLDHSPELQKSQQALLLLQNYLGPVVKTKAINDLISKVKLVEAHKLNQASNTGDNDFKESLRYSGRDESKTTIVIKNDLSSLEQPLCRDAFSKLVQAALSAYENVAGQFRCKPYSWKDLFVLQVLRQEPEKPITFEILFPKVPSYQEYVLNQAHEPNSLFHMPSKLEHIYPPLSDVSLSGTKETIPLNPYDALYPSQNVHNTRNPITTSGNNPLYPWIPNPADGNFLSKSLNPGKPQPPNLDQLFNPVNQSPTSQNEPLVELHGFLEEQGAKNGQLTPLGLELLKYLYPEENGFDKSNPNIPEKRDIWKYLDLLGLLPKSPKPLDENALDALLKNSPWFAGTNLHKLPELPNHVGFLELTYLLKRPKPLIYHPVYYVKYRLPYKTFIQNYRDLISKNPELQGQPSVLHKALLALSNITQMSPELDSYGKDEVLKLVFGNGALVDAKFIKGPSNNFLNEQLELIKKLNSDVGPELLEKGTLNWLNKSNAGHKSPSYGNNQLILSDLSSYQTLNQQDGGAGYNSDKLSVLALPGYDGHNRLAVNTEMGVDSSSKLGFHNLPAYNNLNKQDINIIPGEYRNPGKLPVIDLPSYSSPEKLSAINLPSYSGQSIVTLYNIPENSNFDNLALNNRQRFKIYQSANDERDSNSQNIKAFNDLNEYNSLYKVAADNVQESSSPEKQVKTTLLEYNSPGKLHVNNLGYSNVKGLDLNNLQGYDTEGNVLVKNFEYSSSNQQEVDNNLQGNSNVYGLRFKVPGVNNNSPGYNSVNRIFFKQSPEENSGNIGEYYKLSLGPYKYSYSESSVPLDQQLPSNVVPGLVSQDGFIRNRDAAPALVPPSEVVPLDPKIVSVKPVNELSSNYYRLYQSLPTVGPNDEKQNVNNGKPINALADDSTVSSTKQKEPTKS